MTSAPLKTCQNQKPSNQLLNTCGAGSANCFHQRHIFVKHPSPHALLNTIAQSSLSDSSPSWHSLSSGQMWTHHEQLAATSFTHMCMIHLSIPKTSLIYFNLLKCCVRTIISNLIISKLHITKSNRQNRMQYFGKERNQSE